MMMIQRKPPTMPAFKAPDKPHCLIVLARTKAIYDTDMGERGNWTPAAHLAMDAAFRTAVCRAHPEHRALSI